MNDAQLIYQVLTLIQASNHSRALATVKTILPPWVLEGMECAIDSDRLGRLSILNACQQDDKADDPYAVYTKPSKEVWRRATEQLIADAENYYEASFGVFASPELDWENILDWFDARAREARGEA